LGAPDAVIWGRRSVLTVYGDLIELKKATCGRSCLLNRRFYVNFAFKAQIPRVAKITYKWDV
jgi:hypothetical protein